MGKYSEDHIQYAKDTDPSAGMHAGKAAPGATRTPIAPAGIDLKGAFVQALDLSTYSDIARGIISDRTPDQIINAFETVKPEWKDALEEIKADPALATALHSALVKDPTMLDGFAGLVDSGNGKTSPDDVAASLQDPKARAALTAVLTDVADKDEYDFTTFKKFVESQREEQLKMFTDMGHSTTELMDWKDMTKVLVDFLRNPKEFLNNLPQMMGMGPEQAKAFAPILNGIGTYMDLVLGPISGETKGYGGLLADATEWGMQRVDDGSAQKYIQDLSGETDANNLASMSALDPEKSGQAGSHFDPNASGTRTDGYKPDQVAAATPPAPVVPTHSGPAHVI